MFSKYAQIFFCGTKFRLFCEKKIFHKKKLKFYEKNREILAKAKLAPSLRSLAELLWRLIGKKFPFRGNSAKFSAGILT